MTLDWFSGPKIEVPSLSSQFHRVFMGLRTFKQLLDDHFRVRARRTHRLHESIDAFGKMPFALRPQ